MTKIQTIINKIKNGELKMKPKWHFMLKTVLAILAALGVAIAMFFLVGLILFILRLSGGLYLLKFGLKGVVPFFFSVPWLLLLVLIILVILLGALTRRFSLVYRRPILYSFLGFIFLALLGGFFIDKTPVHSSLLIQAEKDKLPIMGKMYRDYGVPKTKNVYRGKVVEFVDDGFVLQTRNRKDFKISTSSKTRLRPGIKIKQNDVVVVWGKPEKGEIKALGVKPINDHLKKFLPEKTSVYTPAQLHKDKGFKKMK